MTRLTRAAVLAILVAVAALPIGVGPADAKPVPQICSIQPDQLTPPEILQITGTCKVPARPDGTLTKYYYNRVHIIDGGELIFQDGNIEFWAKAIIVEAGGKLIIGTPTEPIGTKDPKNVVTIKLYGAPQPTKGIGVPCISTSRDASKRTDTCGAPSDIWDSNLNLNDIDPVTHMPRVVSVGQAQKVKNCKTKNGGGVVCEGRDSYPGPDEDYFYAYHPLFHDEGDHGAYFGYKTLGVAYGGTLQLFGKKGAIYSQDPKDAACNPTGPDSAQSTGRSWVRLAATAKQGDAKIAVVKPPCGLGWTDGDDIVITTTDYLPGHSEQRKIKGDPVDKGDGTVEIELTAALAWEHHGVQFSIPTEAVSRLDLAFDKAETRAAVGLLSRNIRIASAGCALGEELPAAKATCKTPSPAGGDAYFGGQTVFRQGYRTVQIQGVEFYQMGQGGRLGHYPVHFHHARGTLNPKSPDLATFVMDSSIWDSMTRWIVLHGTHDVTLARNVGYLSIGHGFYLEDGTEINNKLLANLGVFARAAVDNGQNPRKVPGILAAPDLDTVPVDNRDEFPFRSDYDHPTVFWITNGWNDFQYNMAAGAGTCGACYWFVSAANSTMSRQLKWESYASMQAGLGRAGTTPLKSFVGNSCTTAMTSFQTVTATEACLGVGPNLRTDYGNLPHVKNPLAANAGAFPRAETSAAFDYYPLTDPAGGRFATLCGGTDCSAARKCASGAENLKNCAITVLDHYTTAFSWAPLNFAAVWLRPQWYLLSNSVISDAQQAGVTMVTGGGYSESDVITGHWALTTKSVFIGATQENPGAPKAYPSNPYASNGGPFNPQTKLRCAQDGNKNRPGNPCLSVEEGISAQISNFGMYQRLFSVYDGPAYQESNAYLNIKVRELDDCKPTLFGVSCVPNDPSPECNPLCLSGDLRDICQSRTCSTCSGINCHFVADPNAPNDPTKNRMQCDKVSEGRCVPTDNTVSNDSAWLTGIVQGLPKGYPDPLRPDESKAFCFMPNAAIGWKQPNGFYYPPAFHSTNLFFDNVDIRHFVVTPLFTEGTLRTDTGRAAREYCKWSSTLFEGFNSIDRQTVLNDDDGSLTGYKGTTVINLDDFFLAPVDAVQCLSDATSRTSPYEYVSTVIYPGPAQRGGNWSEPCSNEHCYGIPLYRLDQFPTGDAGHDSRSLRMMGQSTFQRSSLTVNHGNYYVDTTVGLSRQQEPGISNVNVFQRNGTYYLFLLYAKEDTEQTYIFYTGTGKNAAGQDFDPAVDIKLVQVDVRPKPHVFGSPQLLPAGRATWFDKSRGLVKVVLKAADLKPSFADLLEKERVKSCQPASFCTWNTDTKSCNDCVTGSFNLATGKCTDSGTDTICRWAGSHLHCPEGGCPGIVFTLPDGFTTDQADDPRLHVPVACLPKAAPWDLTFKDPDPKTVGGVTFTPQQVGGLCYHAPKLAADFCK